MSRYIESWVLFFADIIFYLVQSRKSYPYMKLHGLKNNDPNKFCEGYICEHSGLTESIINRMLNIDNKLRNRNALSNNISNLYMLEWYPVLEYWAQDKANLCLPPTQYEFYDFVVIQKYGTPKYHSKGQDACQVVIAFEPTKAENTTPREIKQKIIDYIYQNRLHHFKRLAGNQWGLNRKQVSQVGCGYTIRLNKTHYIDHLVCLYCAFEFKQKGLHYVVRRGPPCTECNYYQTEYPWRCGKRYKHLCVASIIHEDQQIQTIEHKNCLPTQDNSSTSIQRTEMAILGKIIQRKILHDYSSAEMKPPADELSQLYSVNKGKMKGWSLLKEIHKANQFSYRHEADFECNLCKYLVIFAACSTGVIVIVVAYVLYFIKCYQREKLVTA